MNKPECFNQCHCGGYQDLHCEATMEDCILEHDEKCKECHFYFENLEEKGE